MKRPRSILLPLLLACAACGPPSGSSGGSAAATAVVNSNEVAVSGHIAAPGTKGPLLVFALAGDGGDPAERETLSVATVDGDGNFAFTMPPVDVATFAFLADGSNDGVIDGGDPIAVLSGPSFSDLGGGETVVLTDVALDFTAHKATAANIDVRRSGGGETRTPTAVPAS
ncbi:hypothetical protein KF840_19595 [bacterium]|nr:hypothetical protein [bacterium]